MPDCFVHSGNGMSDMVHPLFSREAFAVPGGEIVSTIVKFDKVSKKFDTQILCDARVKSQTPHRACTVSGGTDFMTRKI